MQWSWIVWLVSRTHPYFAYSFCCHDELIDSNGFVCVKQSDIEKNTGILLCCAIKFYGQTNICKVIFALFSSYFHGKVFNSYHSPANDTITTDCKVSRYVVKIELYDSVQRCNAQMLPHKRLAFLTSSVSVWTPRWHYEFNIFHSQ